MEILMLLEWSFDLLLTLMLLWVAWMTLSSPGLLRAIVLFISFGLLMTLAWVRLDAPDIALAEVAIGAGLTGALLLSAWARLNQMPQPHEPESTEKLLHNAVEDNDNEKRP